ncbi:MAG TPA: class I SAM-dependent methyltransferase [Rhodothermia bacterium]|nr:class I SAM-dependent methyltransferase [Rhodothermia bacterium]
MKLSEKWNRASRTYNLVTFGEDLRQGDEKRRLYARARGRTIFVAAGTGNDIKFFPPGLDIVGLDVSPGMIEKARPRAARYPGRMELRVMDAQQLDFAEGSFDTAITACTFCSVPDPVRGLRELYRVLKPGGSLLMFEHVRSEVPMVGLFLDLLTYVTRLIGPDLNRDTVANVRRAGFRVVREQNVYFDIVKSIEAAKPPEAS